MALTPNEAEISLCNEALGLLDETAISTSGTGETFAIDDETDKSYILCNRYYTQAINEMLQRHYWREATERAVIQQSGVPPFGYDYEYDLPSDFIRLYRIDSTGSYASRPKYSSEAYSVEGDKLLTYEGYVPQPTIAVEGTTYYEGDVVLDIHGNALICVVESTTASEDLGNVQTDGGLWSNLNSYGRLLNIIYIKSIAAGSLGPLLRECVKYNLAIKISPGLARNQDEVQALTEKLETILIREAKSIDSMEKFPVQRFNSEWVNSRYK